MDYQQFPIQLPQLFNNWGEASCHPKSDFFQFMSTKVNSMISPNVMQLLNFAVSCLDENEIYCEIGAFTGASLISALVNNPDKIAYAVDNFSELDSEGENFDKLTNNLEEFNISDQVFFCYQDAEEFLRDLKNQELTEKIGVYFYDGSQNYRSYLLGLLALKPIISNQALIIITNCQWTSCQQAVRDFLTTNSEARLMIDFTKEDYLLWNGIQILSWDSQGEYHNNSESEDDVNVDLPVQEAIANITKVEIANFVISMESQASLLFQNKKYSEVERIYLTLLQFNKNNASLWQNLGSLYYEEGEYLKALDCLNKTLEIDDSQGTYHYTIGLILEKLQINQAIIAYEKAIELNPKLVDAYNNLGNIFLAQDEVDKAEVIFRKAITDNPLHFGGYINLGNLLLDKRQEVDEAILYYKKALTFNQKNADIVNNLIFAYKLKNNEFESLYYQAYSFYYQYEYEQAIKVYKQLINIVPEATNLYLYLLLCLHSLGKTKEAIEEVELGLQLSPNNLLIQIASLQIMPCIYQDTEEIEFCRDYFSHSLQLLNQNLSLDTDTKRKNTLDAISSSKQTNFYLAYQCKNDLDLQKQYGQIVHKIVAANYPQWCQDLPCSQLRPGEKIRVGYISSHLHNHNGAKWSLGWIKNHDRQNFQIYCYHSGVNIDQVTEYFQLYSDSFVHIPNDLAAICNQIISDKLHILVFPAIGMKAMDGLIASLRLAPIQCTAWGHPVTSGLPTVDYYLSSELMESENAQEHYSEALIRLPNIGLCYSKPILPEVKKSRSELGIPEDCILYLCCQSTFKYLPQYDYIFPEIAKQVGNAKFVFISAPQGQHITNIFQQRLEKAFAKLGLNSEEYCIILPRQSNYEFLQLNQISDIFLDTLGWNGGNTTLNAISCNLPVVTCPGEFMRGRHSYAFLKMLGITDTIANSEAEYIEIAVKLGLDINWRNGVADFGYDFYLLAIAKLLHGQYFRLLDFYFHTLIQQRRRNNIAERMSKNHERVFDDKTCVQGLETFYKQVVQQKSSSSP